MIYFKRLKIQISMFYLMLSFSTVILVSTIIYFSVSNMFVEEAIVKTTMALQKSSDMIEGYIDKIKDISKILSENPSLIEYLESGEKEEEAAIKQQINTILEVDNHIQSITIAAKDGRLMGSKEGLDRTVFDEIIKEDWYIKAMEDNMPLLTGARMQKLFGDEDEWVISLSREINDYQGNSLGVLVINLRYCFIGDYIEDLNLGEQGYIYMLNVEDELIYHEDAAYLKDEDKKRELINIYRKGDSYNKKLKQLSYHTKVENTNWILIGILSLDNLRMLEKQVLELVMITGLLIFVSILVSGSFFANRISRPLENLEKTMEEIEDLKEVQVDRGGFYETILLAESYNKMLRRIRELMEELKEKEKSLGRLEINALISQINPHFLYNTLDTIVWMAEFNENDKVIDMTKSLAKFFRLSLNKGRELVTIEEEIEHIKEYLYIQKVRYEEKLEYVIDVDQSILKEYIPKIMLQPIVENSIYHGIKYIEGKGHIWIEVQDKGDKIVLRVVDDGIGFDKDDQTPNRETRLSGIGLQNVEKRIKLYYGEEYGIKITSQKGCGCSVELTIGRGLIKD